MQNNRESNEERTGWAGWAIDLVLGTLAGGIVGAIVAVNVVIYSGIDSGYEASMSQILEDEPVAGVLALTAFVTAPVLGVGILRRLRRKRT